MAVLARQCYESVSSLTSLTLGTLAPQLIYLKKWVSGCRVKLEVSSWLCLAEERSGRKTRLFLDEELLVSVVGFSPRGNWMKKESDRPVTWCNGSNEFRLIGTVFDQGVEDEDKRILISDHNCDGNRCKKQLTVTSLVNIFKCNITY